jgi:hypothetical protein
MTLDISGSTQYGEKFALRNTQQDGYAAGKLNEITVSNPAWSTPAIPTATTSRWARSR